ncbi:MAG: sulfotransferase family protein [Shimia sp.]|nr:sulfotransferase family protein [Shimia sp.]
MTRDSELLNLVDGTLDLLDTYRPATDASVQSGAAFDSLLAQCQRYTAQVHQEAAAPIRLIHHFACTGGTLMSRALACQPNTMVLSEVDPFSKNTRVSAGFAPSDLIYLACHDRNPPSQETVAEMFLQQLDVLYRASQKTGQQLLIRDHSHSHFCEYLDPSDRPLMGELIAGRFESRALVTVRHPLDSYLSLHSNGWAGGLTATLEAYAGCYSRFLDRYRGLEIFHYERFAEHPDAECQRLAEALSLDYEPRWQDYLSVVRLTGDSGRSTRRIALRPRRALIASVASQWEDGAPQYQALCARLGYDPNPEGSLLPLI